MTYLTYTPPAPLGLFVEKFWLYQGYKRPHAKERLLPTGTVEIVVNLRADELRLYDKCDHQRCRRYDGSIVVGPQSEYFIIDTAQQASVMGAHFRPGGAFPFFGAPVDELANQHLSLTDLWRGAGFDLGERLLEAATPEAKFRVFERALLERATRPLAGHPAVSYALREFHSGPQPRTVSDVTGRMGLSAKRFIQLFRDEVGLTPKLFCRIQRFQRVIHSIGAGKAIAWADVAASCGYFDQAHFIHDFKSFSGINPSLYQAWRTPHLNHVPLCG